MSERSRKELTCDAAAQQRSARLQTAFALHEGGVALKRAQLRRQDPTASEAEIGRRLGTWLQTRPGAEFGDSVGTPKVFAEPGR